MANYFQDPSQSFVPTPVYRPPFEAIQATLMAKQQKYDAGLSNVRSVYNSIFNAPLTNGENSQVRAQFLTDAENKLKNLSQVDLSIESNQNEARNVFAPFYKDQAIITDIATTKYNTQQLQIANRMAQSTDQKERDGYFAESVQDIQNTMDDIRTGDRNDPNIYKQRNYVIKRDIQGEITKKIHDMGYKVIHVEGMDQPQLVTIEGGEKSLLNYQTVVQGIMGNNYDDMMGVYGRNELHNRTKYYKESGMTDGDARSKAAIDYIGEKSTDLTANIEGFGKAIAAQNAFIKQNQDANGNSLSEQSEQAIAMAKMNIEKLNEQKEDATSSLNTLQNTQSDEYKNIFGSIVKMGDDFFGSIYKKTIANNLAVALASGSTVKVDVNQAYQNRIKNEQDYQNYVLDRDYKQAQINHMNDGTVNPDGSPKIKKDKELKPGDPGAPVDMQDIGVDSTDPLKVENGFETYQHTMKTKFVGGMSKQIDAVAALIPTSLGLDITPADATAWAATFKENYGDTDKPNWNSTSKPVQDKLIKYIKDNNLPFTPGCPSCMIQSIYNKVQDGLKIKSQSVKPLTESELRAIELYTDGSTDLTDYAQKNKVFKDKINKEISEKIKKGDKDLINYTIKQKDGSYQFKTNDDLIKEIGDITIPVQSGRPGGWEPVTIKGKDIVDNLNKGIGIEELLPPHFVWDNVLDPEQQRKLIHFSNKYKNYNSAKQVLDKSIGETMGLIDKEGFLGHNFSLAVVPPTPTNSQGSDGLKLLKDISNPTNRELTAKTSDEAEVENKVFEILLGNPEYVSNIVYNTTGVATIYLNAQKMKDGKSGIPTGVTSLKVKLAPTATGTVIDKLPIAKLYQKYQKLVEGEDMKSSAEEDALGYTWRIYGDNYGQKGTKATKLYYERNFKKWDPTTKSYIEDPNLPNQIEEIPLSGDFAKLPDEVMESIAQGRNVWLNHNNAIKIAALNNPTSGVTPYKGLSESEIMKKYKVPYQQ